MDKRPTRPPRKFHARRPPAVRDAAISAEIAAHLAAAPTPPPPISPDDLRDAADLIDAAAPLIPPPPSPPAAAGLAGLAAPGSTALCTISASTATAPTTPTTIRDSAPSAPSAPETTIRDSDGFLAWVNADPGSRVRVAKYLARCYQTGKLSAPMVECGISRGLINCLCQRHPIIRAAMQIIAEGQARGLVHRAREVVESIMDTPDDQTLQLKAASVALQYSQRGCADAGNGPGNGDGGPGGVQIVINLGQQADTPRRIAPDDVRMADQDAIFIVGGGK
ncbi:MAG TPA: hypothetical protein P5111_09780 [Kiritimatiellia bacterium]|nr:hypothetical protein [Kiritimatiellia bacterium]